MFPGTVTKISEGRLASAATISPKSDLVLLTGAVNISNIIPSYGGGFSGILILVPVDGNITLTATGNVAVSVIIPQNRSCVLVYSKAAGKWFPGAIS